VDLFCAFEIDNISIWGNYKYDLLTTLEYGVYNECIQGICSYYKPVWIQNEVLMFGKIVLSGLHKPMHKYFLTPYFVYMYDFCLYI
jgi:hypothetical protein